MVTTLQMIPGGLAYGTGLRDWATFFRASHGLRGAYCGLQNTSLRVVSQGDTLMIKSVRHAGVQRFFETGSVWVDENWRLTFRFEARNAVLVHYQDYHRRG